MLVERAAILCKADLTTEMVGEFPELQGVMGSYYALESKEEEQVANAIRSHYSPLGPKDKVPSCPVGIAVSLADKIDTLVGLFAIGEKPTGSKDPFALRRAALGVIRIILENQLRMPLTLAFEKAFSRYNKRLVVSSNTQEKEKPKQKKARVIQELVDFFADRLKVLLKDENISHDLIEAVFDGGHEDDLERLVRRVRVLDQFLRRTEGQHLLAAYRRPLILFVRKKRKITNRITVHLNAIFFVMMLR
jgi:glycyl-tRNA synthetase beta chain